MNTEADHDTRPAVAPIEARRVAIAAWLASLQWDGVPRLSYALASAFKGSRELCAAVAAMLITATLRAVRPTERDDEQVLVLVGPQGVGKSGLLHALFGDDLTQHAMRDPAASDLAHAWAHEVVYDAPPYVSLSDRFVAALTAERVRARAPYQRITVTVPRWWTIAITAQNETPFTRAPRNPLFRVVEVPKRIDFERVRALRDQLWAEAYASTVATLADAGTDGAR